MTDHDQPAQPTIRAPWRLVDDTTCNHVAMVLERLTGWLDTGKNTDAARSCARALSLDETDDPITIRDWTDTLAAHLRYLTEIAELDPEID